MADNNIKIGHIFIDGVTPCGDSVCCWMPPSRRGNDTSTNVVFELRGGRIPKKLEPVYETGYGRCIFLDFKIRGENKGETIDLAILGRCAVYAERPAGCNDLPRNTKQRYCDYEKCLWSKEKQIEIQHACCTLYWGFKKKIFSGYSLRKHCDSPSTVHAILEAANDSLEKRIKFVKVRSTLIPNTYLVIKIPLSQEIVSNLPLVASEL